jgi:ribosomal protein L40E
MSKKDSGYCQMMGLLTIKIKNWTCRKCGKTNSIEDLKCWKCKEVLSKKALHKDS